MKIIYASNLPKLSPYRIRHREGMEVLMWDGWYKVIFDQNAYLLHGISQNQDQKKDTPRQIQ